jgi:hypothetical protein
MPIVDGRYEARISTTFSSVEEAMDEIKERIRRSRKVWISNIPMSMLRELMPLLEGRSVRIILPMNERPSPELRRLGDVAVTKARIYRKYRGIDANAGSIYFSDRVFNVIWTDDGILDMDALDYRRCVKCMRDMFETGWRYAKK